MLVLVGDMTPKTMALKVADRWARLCARPLEWFAMLVAVPRFLIRLVSDLLLNLVGYAHGHLEGHSLQDLLRPPFFVPRSTKCDRLFREFQRRKTHMALVVDEYGRLIGLVTMEDLLEELFGEISDEKDAPPRVRA